MNALSRFDHRHPALLEALCAQALAKQRSFTPQEASNSLSALARLGHYDGVLVAALCRSAATNARTFNTLEASNFLAALATFEHYDGSAVRAMCNEVKTLNSLHHQGLTNTLMAVATFNHYDKRLLNALCTAATKKNKHSPERVNADNFSNLNIGEVLHSLSVFAHYDQDLYASLLKRFYPPHLWVDISSETKSHLHLVFLSLVADHGAQSLSQLGVPPGLVDACLANAVQVEAEGADAKGGMREDVSGTLKDRGVPHSERARVGGLGVDILLEDDERKGEGIQRVLEIDGPKQFLRAKNGAVDDMGRTANRKGWNSFKDRLLEKQGYKVLHVPYFEWDALGRNAEKKKQYLTRLLASEGQVTTATTTAKKNSDIKI